MRTVDQALTYLAESDEENHGDKYSGLPSRLGIAPRFKLEEIYNLTVGFVRAFPFGIVSNCSGGLWGRVDRHRHRSQVN